MKTKKIAYHANNAILTFLNSLSTEDPIPEDIKSSSCPKTKFEWLYGHIDQILKRYDNNSIQTRLIFT